MARIGSKLHEEVLNELLYQMQKQGYRTINLKGLSPDAIAVKDNKIIAVEALGSTYRKGKGWHNNWTYKNKKESYSMFDDLIIKVFHRPKII